MSFADRPQTKDQHRACDGGRIINHHVIASAARQSSSFINQSAFTLIELLVVISIVALLMAILLPTLSRAHKQAKAVACQANLRHWGIILEAYSSENDGRFDAMLYGEAWSRYSWAEREERWHLSRKLLLCPMAPRPESIDGKSRGSWGGKYSAWWWEWPGPEMSKERQVGSYGYNAGAQQAPGTLGRMSGWEKTDIRGMARIPVMLDCAVHGVSPLPKNPPPEYDGHIRHDSELSLACLDRHNGGVSCVFRDWSVRKVELKELWTLKWWKYFDTSGPWTKAGGVAPEDWPAWMWKFKDY